MRKGDRVRLVRHCEELRAGEEGVVIGFYRHPSRPQVLVELPGVHVRSIAEADLEVVESSPAPGPVLPQE